MEFMKKNIKVPNATEVEIKQKLRILKRRNNILQDQSVEELIKGNHN
jgi:hypothetical protein